MKNSILSRHNIIRSFLRALLTVAFLIAIKWILSNFFNFHIFESNNKTYYLIFFVIFFIANLISNGKNVGWKDISKKQPNR